MGSRDVALIGSAASLEDRIHLRGDYAHVHVQARAGHLIIKLHDDQGGQVTIARATPLGGAQYGLSFRTNSGRWEPMPVSGMMDQVVEGLIDLLGPYLDRANIQEGPTSSGTTPT